MRLLRKALASLRRTEAKPMPSHDPADRVVPLDLHRSKRALIKGVLRRYEQGRITEADAVEELLAMMRSNEQQR